MKTINNINLFNISEFSRKPLFISFSIHLTFLVIFIFIFLFQEKSVISKKINFTVFQKNDPQSIVKPIVKPPTIEKIKIQNNQLKQKAVFGLKRNALTVNKNSSDANSVSIKQGNTITKEQDSETLLPEDPTSLPSPTDEFLVTTMPVLVSEVRIPYPKQAREANKEGPVVLELLIDSEGTVRDVSLISGPGYGLNEAALEAVRGFKFKPAKIDKQSVTVKIRYTYRFLLENN